MTPEALSKRLYALEKKLRQKQIFYSATALAGEADCCRIFGINYTTGDLYYRDADGEWALATSGGGGGGLQNTITNDNILTVDNQVLVGDNALDFIAGTSDYSGSVGELFIDPTIAYLYAQDIDTDFYSQISTKGDQGGIITAGDGVSETTLVVGPDYVSITKDFATPALLIQPGSSAMQAFDATDDGNIARESLDVTPTDSTVILSADFNNGVTQANIELFADVTASSATYTADTHIFVGRVISAVKAADDFVDDVAAAGGGIQIEGFYHTSGVVKIRLT